MMVEAARSEVLAQPSLAVQVALAEMALEQTASAEFAAMQPFAGDRPAEQRPEHSRPFSSALDDDFAEGYCQHFRDRPAAH